MNIVIFLLNVEFSEDFCPLEFVNEIGDKGKGICIVDYMFIDIAIILIEVETTIFLFNEKEGECLWRV